MKYLELLISDWHIETFPNATNRAIIDKLFEEIRELEHELNMGSNNLWLEMADVAIVMIALCERNNHKLSDLIEAKMKINKSREWGKENNEGDRPRDKNNVTE